MQAIGATLRCDVDGRSGGPAILGAFVVGYHLELRNGVWRDSDNLVVESLVALTVGIIVETVQEKVVEHAALAVDVIGAGADEGVDRTGRRGRRSLARTGHQAYQVRVVAGDKGQRLALVVGDGLAAFASLGLKLQGDVADFDHGFSSADPQRQVDALASADRDGDVIGHRIGEALGARRDCVDTNTKRWDFVVPSAVRRCPHRDRRSIVRDGYRCAGDSRAARVMDGTYQTPVLILSLEVGTGQEKQDGRQKRVWIYFFA